MTKEVYTIREDKAYNYGDKIKIYEEKSNAWDFLIIRLIDIPSGLVRQCDDNSHESWKELIDKYEVLDENQQTLNEVENMWIKFSINDTSQDTDIWFNELYNLKLKFKKIKENY